MDDICRFAPKFEKQSPVSSETTDLKTDLILVANDGQKFYVESAVVKNGSKFEKLLESCERDGIMIHMKMKANRLFDILNYIYNTNLPTLTSLYSAIKLLEVSREMLWPAMSEHCEHYLIRKLNDSNVKYLLEVATETKSLELLAHAQQFTYNTKNGIPNICDDQSSSDEEKSYDFLSDSEDGEAASLIAATEKLKISTTSEAGSVSTSSVKIEPTTFTPTSTTLKAIFKLLSQCLIFSKDVKEILDQSIVLNQTLILYLTDEMVKKPSDKDNESRTAVKKAIKSYLLSEFTLEKIDLLDIMFNLLLNIQNNVELDSAVKNEIQAFADLLECVFITKTKTFKSIKKTEKVIEKRPVATTDVVKKEFFAFKPQNLEISEELLQLYENYKDWADVEDGCAEETLDRKKRRWRVANLYVLGIPCTRTNLFERYLEICDAIGYEDPDRRPENMFRIRSKFINRNPVAIHFQSHEKKMDFYIQYLKKRHELPSARVMFNCFRFNRRFIIEESMSPINKKIQSKVENLEKINCAENIHIRFGFVYATIPAVGLDNKPVKILRILRINNTASLPAMTALLYKQAWEEKNNGLIDLTFVVNDSVYIRKNNEVHLKSE